jgi:hypothetical protein
MELQGLEKLLSHEQKIEWQRLYEATDKYTDGWLSAGRQLLEECERANKMQENDLHGQVQTIGTSERRLGEVRQVASEGNCNVLVTSGTLIPSLVKCLLFRLNTYFHPLNSKSAPHLCGSVYLDLHLDLLEMLLLRVLAK